MSIAQFHRALQSDTRLDALKTLRHASYEQIKDDGNDKLSNWDPWTP